MRNMRNSITYPVSVWERAIAGRNDIEFIEIRLKNGGVTEVKGFILIRGHRRIVSWRSDGRCYYHGRRATSYDIEL